MGAYEGRRRSDQQRTVSLVAAHPEEPVAAKRVLDRQEGVTVTYDRVRALQLATGPHKGPFEEPLADMLKSAVAEIDQMTAELSHTALFSESIRIDRDTWRFHCKSRIKDPLQCAGSRPGELAYECYATRPCAPCRIRAVAESAEAWRDADSDDEDAIKMSDLMCAIDAYRASKDPK
jgi:hypothetical protein